MAHEGHEGERRMQIQGSQLGSIDKYDPTKEGADVETWCAAVDTAQATFSWSDDQTATAAKSRLSGNASQWLLNELGEGKKYIHWDTGDAPLRKALINRFKIAVTYQNAATLISDLQQKPSESVAGYYDRVRSAVIMKNKVVFSQDQRKSGWYNEVLVNDYKTFFLAGLRCDIKNRLPQPYPAEMEALLSISVGVEAEARRAKFTINELAPYPTLEEPARADDTAKESSMDAAIRELTQEIAALKMQRNKSKKKGPQCWKCGQFGHVRSKCNVKGQQGQGQGGQGGQQRQNQGNSGKRSSVNEISGNEGGEW